jgi:hypothetical protein
MTPSDSVAGETNASFRVELEVVCFGGIVIVKSAVTFDWVVPPVVAVNELPPVPPPPPQPAKIASAATSASPPPSPNRRTILRIMCAP